jgi:hypothetical protein
MVDPYRLCTKLVENVDCVWNEIELDVVYKTDSIDFSHHLTNSNQKEQSGPVNNSIHKRLVIFDQTKEKWICDDVFETTNLVLCTGMFGFELCLIHWHFFFFFFFLSCTLSNTEAIVTFSKKFTFEVCLVVCFHL